MLVAKKEHHSYTKHKTKRKKVIKNKNNRKKSNIGVKLKIIFCSAIVFVSCIFLLSRYAYITKIRLDVSKLEKEVVTLNDKKSDLKIELEKIKDSGWIEQQAKEKINMRPAREDQLIYINVSSNDKKSNKQIAENKDSNFFSGIVDKILNMF
ncbi:cell division protein [Gottschalkia purinilytica]|uniref:Cell division protein n=1 Tax=Gottschalkia purinilytica TaxID=1503 RepID=A0A0L0WEM1_GOTPU|nr:septum formation initiator family protein [Gottschalkia purinilytica]KNF09927.1 cell division protein [Gottschalkia purinilytica]